MEIMKKITEQEQDIMRELRKPTYLGELKHMQEERERDERLRQKQASVSSPPAPAPPEKPPDKPPNRWYHAFRYFVVPRVLGDTSDDLPMFPKIPFVSGLTRVCKSQEAVSERSHAEREWKYQLQSILHELRNKKGTKKQKREGERRLKTCIEQVAKNLRSVGVFRPLLPWERIRPDVFPSLQMLGNDSVNLDIEVYDAFATDSERKKHRDMMLDAFPELHGRGLLTADMGVNTVVVLADPLNMRFFQVAASGARRLVKNFNRPVSMAQSVRSRVVNASSGDQLTEKTNKIKKLDDFMKDKYDRRHHTASRIHESVKAIVRLYDVVVAPLLRPWNGARGWSNATREQATAVRLVGLQSELREMCKRLQIHFDSSLSEAWSTKTCCGCGNVNAVGAKRYVRL